MEELIIPILTALAALVSFILAVKKYKPKLYIIGLIFILVTGLLQPCREIIDNLFHKTPDVEVKNKFPNDLDFFAHNLIRFNSGADFLFDVQNVKADIKITRIYWKDGKFFAYILFNVTDRKNRVLWIDQKAEVELLEHNLVKGQTDRLDFYFYVAKLY